MHNENSYKNILCNSKINTKKELQDEALLQRQKLADLDKEWSLLQKISKEPLNSIKTIVE